MKSSILGYKILQEQTFTEKGERIPTTRILTEHCYLVGTKTKEKDGYNALIIGFGKTKRMSKPRAGILKKAGIKIPLRFLRESKVDTFEYDQNDNKKLRMNNVTISIGEELFANKLFSKGSYVKITGDSKGKGFQGVVKRHHFKGGPRTHGQSDRERAPGSIGMSTTPGRVFKGKRMAGRMGSDTVTIKNLEIIDVNEKEIVVKGLVPGPKNGLLLLSHM